MTKSNSSENPQTPRRTDAPKRLLDGIRSPADIKALREQDLPQLAQEVRDELIKVLSQTGGHLGPNLGVVELTIALHRVFDTPRDRFVMDVSHQGYVHKMFTGRLDRFHTMRQFEGLNGFLLRTESEHDCYGAGHAARRFPLVSAWLSGRDLRGGDEKLGRIAGDAAFTCGISYEALNNVKTHTKRFIVVLNDNEWSIAKNVGAIANYLNSIVTNPTYAHLHDKARDFVQAILGKTGVQLAHKVEESVKGLLVPSVIFEELGLRYYGPIDGHDIPLADTGPSSF
jgi:1-deoxy-D-xylulose-5-phosphate synthase